MVAMYNRALNATEIDSNFNAGPDAEANISPLSVIRNQGLVQFSYTISRISSLSPEVGAVDKISIANPFTSDSMFVSSVTVDGTPYYLLNSGSQPSGAQFATWEYDATADSLHIRTDDFQITDEITIEFFVNVPDDEPGIVSFPSRIDAVTDGASPYAIDPGNYDVEVTPSAVAYYTFTPSTARSMNAGDPGLTYFLQSRDEFGNATANNDSVYLSAVGGNFVEFVGGSTRGFGGGSSITVTVRDSVAESFTIRAESNVNPEIIGQSGLVTVSPNNPSQVQMVSSLDTMTVGTERQIQLLLQDQYGNLISGEDVTLTRTQGNGYFVTPGNADTTITSVNGIVQVIYTTSSDLSVGTDSINVTHLALIDTTFGLPLRADIVSYYTFAPVSDTSFTAGGSLQFILTARDQFGNGVRNNGSAGIDGGAGVTIVEGTPLSFSGDSTVTFNVQKTLAEDFSITATNTVNSQITGQSGLIQVLPADADHFVILSNLSPVVVGGQRQIKIALEDQYNNRLADSVLTLTAFQGTGYFGIPGNQSASVQTDASGVIDTIYTASNSLALGFDSIRVELPGLLSQTFGYQLQSDIVSYYTFAPNADTSFTAGDPAGLDFTITARDQYGNGVVNSNQITLRAVGASGAIFDVGTTPSFSNSSTLTFTVTDDIAENFTIRADSATVSGQSGLITVNPGTPDHLVVLSDTSQVVVGGQRLIQVALEDANNNRLDSTLVFTSVQGNGYFGTPGNGDTTIATTNGIAQVTYTASDNLFFGEDSIQIQVQGDATGLTMWLRLRAANVS